MRRFRKPGTGVEHHPHSGVAFCTAFTEGPTISGMRVGIPEEAIVALVADDDDAERRALVRALAAVWPGLRIVQAVNGIEAWDGFLEHEPALCFLDLRMPGLTGIEVAQRIGERARMVFVMHASDRALPSFEAGAIDHLRKPLDPASVAALVGRLQSALSVEHAAALPSLEQLLDRLAGQLRRPAPIEGIEAVEPRAGEPPRWLPVDDIVYLEAEALCTRVVSRGGEALVRTPLKQLAAQLDPRHFWQIDRFHVVNHQHVVAARQLDEQTMVVSLREQSRTLPVAPHFQGRFRSA